jgi:hypothetical protein
MSKYDFTKLKKNAIPNIGITNPEDLVVEQLTYLVLEHIHDVISTLDKDFKFDISTHIFEDKLKWCGYETDPKIGKLTLNSSIIEYIFSGKGKLTNSSSGDDKLKSSFGSSSLHLLFSIFLLLRQHHPEEVAIKDALRIGFLTIRKAEQTEIDIVKKGIKSEFSYIISLEKSKFKAETNSKLPAYVDEIAGEIIEEKTKEIDKGTKDTSTPKTPTGGETTKTSKEYNALQVKAKRLEKEGLDFSKSFNFMRIGVGVLRDRKRINAKESGVLLGDIPDDERNYQTFLERSITSYGTFQGNFNVTSFSPFQDVYKCNSWII